MRVDLHPCFVLHQRAYRESSLLLDVISAEYGRVGLVAKGVSGKRSERRTLLQAFRPLLIAWSGQGDLRNLVDVEANGKLINLQGKRLFCGFYVNELLIRVLHRYDPCPEIFTLYDMTIAHLESEDDIEFSLRNFEKKLIQAIGYGMNLTQEINTGEDIFPDQRYIYIADAGPSYAQEGRQYEHGIEISGQTLTVLASDQQLKDLQTRQEAKNLMRYLLSPLIGDKPLQSRKFFENMK